MRIDPSIFRDYDVRAIIPEQLDKEGAVRIGQVLVKIFSPKTVACGHDMRISQGEIAGGLIEGILAQGANVVDLGLISTDMAYFAAGKYGYDLAMAVSASHNPSQYNGFKLVKKGAIAVSGDSGIYDIRDLAISDKKIKPADKKGRATKKNITRDFVEHCLNFVEVGKIKPAKVVIDAGNGMAGYMIPKFEKYLPIFITPLYFELDGTFPNHLPNPLLPAATIDLKKKILAKKANFGIAFDGDGDRMCLLDEKGKLLSGTVTTAMLAEMILRKHPGETILYNAVIGRIVPEIIKKNGGKAIRVRVGHTLIKEAMRKYNAYFAGEHSGHYYFRDNFYADSAFVAMLLALELISQKNQPLSQIRTQYEKYPAISETNFEVRNKMKVMKMLETANKDKAKSIDWLDGVSIWFDDGWINVRPSNTQPLLRLNIEADNRKILSKLKKEFMEKIEALGGKKMKE